MRADRLLSILLLLQKHGRLTASSLAKRLEVAERTIHRDMSALGTAGVPVVADRGVNGGWSLMPGYRASISALDESEMRALFFGAPAAMIQELKLDRIHIDLSGWKQSRDPVPFLPLVQRAVFLSRRIRFVYGEHARERIADPLGLVAKGSVWYLVARVEGDVRTYRISRMRDATELHEHFNRGEFDLAAYWQAAAAEFKEKLPRFDVVVRTRDPRLPTMMRWGAIDAIEDDIVRMHFDSEDAAVSSLATLDGEVIEPASIREQILQAAKAAITRYAG